MALAHATRRRRTIAIGVVMLFAITTAAVGCAPEAPSTAATATVGKDGARLEMEGGIVVTADADVAPEGTEIRAEIVEQDVPGEFATFAEQVTPVIDITLGDDLQPASPLGVAFTFTEDQAAELNPEHLFVLGESDTEGRDADFIESVWDPATRTLFGTVEHLSWYTATQVDGAKLDNQVGHWLQAQAGVRSQKPACVDEPIEPSGSYILSSPWPDAVWVCARETADTVTVELESNSGLVYEMLSKPTGEYGELAALSPSGVLTTLAARYADQAGFLEGDTVILPGGSMDITYDKPFDPVYMEVQIEPVLSQISSLTFGASMLLPTKWSERLDWYSCVMDSFETLAGAEALKAITSCVAAGIGGSGGGLLNILATGPGLVFTQIEGAVRTAQGSNNEGFTVSLIAADAVRELPAGADWLFNHSAGGTNTSGDEDVANIPGSGTEVLAYPFSTNQWISCTSTPNNSTYALGGNWKMLSLGVAVQAHAPDGLTGAFQIIGDGRVLWTGDVARQAPQSRMDLDVTGVQKLTVTALTDYRPCSGASKGWGALVQAYLK